MRQKRYECQINTPVNRATYNEIEKISNERGQSMAEFVREFFAEVLAKNGVEKC